MSSGSCITVSDIEELRNLVSELKTNLYTWISEKQNTNEIFDSLGAGMNSDFGSSVSIGTMSVAQTSTTIVSSDDAISRIGSILGF